MDTLKTFYTADRKQWRKWLEVHFDKEAEIWLVYPKKSSGKKRIIYNDAVEEALCFGWIDSIYKTLDEHHTIQRFTPRKPKSGYSQPNKERIKCLAKEKLIHPSVAGAVEKIVNESFDFPADIIGAIKQDKEAWKHYCQFSESYKRIRIAYIDSARKRPEKFQKRLANFIDKTKAGKQIKGFRGIEKYY